MLNRKKSSVVTYHFSVYFIRVYVSFIIVKHCGFVMGFVILAIYFRSKTNVKTSNLNGIFFLNPVVRYYYLFDYWIH